MSDRLSGPSMLALVASLEGPALWRILQPFTALERLGYPCGWDMTTNHAVGVIAPAFDGYVLSRMSWDVADRPIADAWLRRLRADGKLVVYDADDDLFSPAATDHLLAAGLASGKTRATLEAGRAARIWALRQADGVTVSTEHLAAIVGAYTERPVIVVPNAIDLPWFRRVVAATSRRTPGLTIGWAGGQRADDDLAAMAEGWGRIAARYPDVTFVVAGYRPAIIAARVPAERLVVLPWRPVERYPSSFREIDIGCAAMAPSAFNAGKSTIKAMEYAAAGAAVVASSAYGQLVEHERSGLIADDSDAWTEQLAALVERPALRAILARRLTRHVERHCSLAGNLRTWPDAWRAIAESARAERLVAV
jgi:glycosyltransferase involved in cell wall biosynthesis